MGNGYSYVGAVVGATYPEMGKVLREIMPKTFILVPGYGAQGGKGADLVHFFNKDGLGAIVNSSRGIIAAYKQEKYAAFGEEGYADASRQALVPGYGAQGGKGADLVHFFNKDGLGAIVNSSRGIIAAYKQEKYAAFGEEGYADASRQAVKDMIEDISGALNNS